MQMKIDREGGGSANNRLSNGGIELVFRDHTGEIACVEVDANESLTFEDRMLHAEFNKNYFGNHDMLKSAALSTISFLEKTAEEFGSETSPSKLQIILKKQQQTYALSINGQKYRGDPLQESGKSLTKLSDLLKGFTDNFPMHFGRYDRTERRTLGEELQPYILIYNILFHSVSRLDYLMKTSKDFGKHRWKFYTEQLMKMIQDGKTPYHEINNAARALAKNDMHTLILHASKYVRDNLMITDEQIKHQTTRPSAYSRKTVQG